MTHSKCFRLYLTLAMCAVVGVAEAGDLAVTPSTDATAMANALLGSGVSVVGTPTLKGVTNQSGLFSGGGMIGLGIESGVVLTTGDARLLPGINRDATETLGLQNDYSTNFTTDLKTPGDSDLDAIVGTTKDAAVLGPIRRLGCPPSGRASAAATLPGTAQTTSRAANNRGGSPQPFPCSSLAMRA